MPAPPKPTSLSETLTVKVTPRAKREQVKHEVLADGTECYRVYVNAPPEEGKANTAVLRLLAEALGVPRSRLSIVQGETSRNKVVKISR